jgi:hypothetical protein
MHRSAAIEIIDPSGDAREPQPRNRWARWLRLAFVLLALGGFGGLVAYVYYGMIRDTATPDGQIPLVRADPAPFRARPENPGGTEIPNQNFEVYDRLGQPTQTPATPGGRQVERLLPPPEAPMPRPAAAPAALAPAPPQAPSVGAPPSSAAPAGPQPGAGAPSPANPAPPAAGAARDRMPGPAAPPQPPTPAQAPAQAPGSVATAPVAAAPGAGGSVRVQVGALATQDAAAREAERLRRSYGSVFGRVGITVVRGESGGSPIYRIQAGPVRDRAAADELCSQLRQHHVGCIIVAR